MPSNFFSLHRGPIQNEKEIFNAECHQKVLKSSARKKWHIDREWNLNYLFNEREMKKRVKSRELLQPKWQSFIKHSRERKKCLSCCRSFGEKFKIISHLFCDINLF